MLHSAKHRIDHDDDVWQDRQNGPKQRAYGWLGRALPGADTEPSDYSKVDADLEGPLNCLRDSTMRLPSCICNVY